MIGQMYQKYFCLGLTVLISFGSFLKGVSGQFCADTCPPLVNNVPIPSLCEGDTPSSSITSKIYTPCNPTQESNIPTTFTINDFAREGQVTVIANLYIGCNAGRRESGVFAHVAQRYYNTYGDKVMFINSLKGGAACNNWPSIYQDDAVSLYPNSAIIPKEMPMTVNDVDFQLRDDFFTSPFGHPSYVILDENLQIRKKFVGPCCGYVDFFDCTADIAIGLDAELSNVIDSLIEEQQHTEDQQQTLSPTGSSVSLAPTESPTVTRNCTFSDWSNWSTCSISCGSQNGEQFRYRIVDSIDPNTDCPSPVEVQACTPLVDTCNNFCVPDIGEEYQIETISTDLNGPRDVAFHPTPGLHLGDYSEGRVFHAGEGEEAWIANGGNHSVSIVAALGTDKQTTISRRDRGHYHYMIEITALSFNTVSDSGRAPDRDSFNYWALCNDNLNTYMGTKEPNYFMGPTLYNSDPNSRNTVNRMGEQCGEAEPCFFLHSDMLHEAPACIGITHDPETNTGYGNVYWAFDTTGNNENGQLVRFDFQQPHGPGSMDHSVASVRRYPEVKLTRGPEGVHAGMVVHPNRRELFISNTGDGSILMVKPDSGTFARTAREEYPIYSNRLPSFEYSVWECAEQKVFASNIEMPSGLAISPDGERLYVAEHKTGKIHSFEISSGALLTTIETGFTSIGGLDFSPSTNTLYFVDGETNSLNTVVPQQDCPIPYESRLSPNFTTALENAETDLNDSLGPNSLSLIRNYKCDVDSIIPNATFFEQVHTDSGYASNNTDVQSEAGMDESAALLANRTDCEFDSELNFDGLLLGGYFCHVCLPGGMIGGCDFEGTCTNVQWAGYTCSNEFNVMFDEITNEMKILTLNGVEIDPNNFTLQIDTTYRFVIKASEEVCIYENNATNFVQSGNVGSCATMGQLILTTSPELERHVFLHSSSTGSVIQLTLENRESMINEEIEEENNIDPSSAFSLGAFSISSCFFAFFALICQRGNMLFRA